MKNPFNPPAKTKMRVVKLEPQLDADLRKYGINASHQAREAWRTAVEACKKLKIKKD